MKRVSSHWWLVSLIVSVLIFARCFCVEAQQPKKIPRIGFLDSSTFSGNAGLMEAFWQEMRKLGWIQGKNITIEYRFAENKGTERISELASDLVRLHVDLIVTSGAGPSVAAKKLTTDRGRERLSPSPPSEPCVQFSRTRLSSRWFPHRDWYADT